jgi:hypothetical protein
MPAHVELSDIKGPEGERARTLYAVPDDAPAPKPARKPARASFNERSAPARGRMREKKQEYRKGQQNAARRRSGANKAIRGGLRKAARAGRGAHRASGSPGATIAGMLTLFIGAGILVAIVRSPAIVTVPMRFIGDAIHAFVGLFSGVKSAGPPKQNVARKG